MRNRTESFTIAEANEIFRNGPAKEPELIIAIIAKSSCDACHGQMAVRMPDHLECLNPKCGVKAWYLITGVEHELPGAVVESSEEPFVSTNVPINLFEVNVTKSTLTEGYFDAYVVNYPVRVCAPTTIEVGEFMVKTMNKYLKELGSDRVVDIEDFDFNMLDNA